MSLKLTVFCNNCVADVIDVGDDRQEGERLARAYAIYPNWKATLWNDHDGRELTGYEDDTVLFRAWFDEETQQTKTETKD